MKSVARPPLRRLATVDRLLRAGRYPNISTLARELEVCQRTVYRDLVFLRDSLGAPLAYSPARRGFHYTAPDFALPLVRLSEGELVALFLAERVMHQYRGTPYAKDLAAAFRKLTGALPDEVTLQLDHLQDAYSFRTRPVIETAAATFSALAEAVRHGRQLELVYWSASRNAETRRTVKPYHLAALEGDWYLIAFCQLRHDVRMFVPSRIRSLRVLDTHFERPVGFDIDAYLTGSFRAMRGTAEPQTVRLRFTPAAARYVRERVWHASQQLRELRGGRLEVTFQLRDLLEVRHWALSYGADCEVLEPTELRELVRVELRAALERYEGAKR